MDVLGCEEAPPPGIERELPGFFGDPRDHRRQYEIEPSPALARARFIVETPNVTLNERLEELAPELDHLVVVWQRPLFAIGVGLDSFVHGDDPAEARRFLALVRAQAQRRRDASPTIACEQLGELRSTPGIHPATSLRPKLVHHDKVKRVDVLVD